VGLVSLHPTTDYLEPVIYTRMEFGEDSKQYSSRGRVRDIVLLLLLYYYTKSIMSTISPKGTGLYHSKAGRPRRSRAS